MRGKIIFLASAGRFCASVYGRLEDNQGQLTQGERTDWWDEKIRSNLAKELLSHKVKYQINPLQRVILISMTVKLQKTMNSIITILKQRMEFTSFVRPTLLQTQEKKQTL